MTHWTKAFLHDRSSNCKRLLIYVILCAICNTIASSTTSNANFARRSIAFMLLSPSSPRHGVVTFPSTRTTVAVKKEHGHGRQLKVSRFDADDHPASKYPCNYDIPSLYNDTIQCGGGRDMITHIRYLHQSLLKLTGRGVYERMNVQRNDDMLLLSDSNEQKREFVYNAICKNERFVLISHGTEASPVYNFGNTACLNAFARSWENLTCMPSKECVVSKSQDEKLRIELMKNVTDYGFVDGEYRSYRTRGDGKFLKLTECVVWNCHDDKGEYIGQAALFDRDVSPVVDSTNE